MYICISVFNLSDLVGPSTKIDLPSSIIVFLLLLFLPFKICLELQLKMCNNSLYCRYHFIYQISVCVTVHTCECLCEGEWGCGHSRLAAVLMWLTRWGVSREYDTLCHDSQFLVLQQVGCTINNGWQRKGLGEGGRLVRACAQTCPFIKIQQSVSGYVLSCTCRWDGKFVPKYLY